MIGFHDHVLPILGWLGTGVAFLIVAAIFGFIVVCALRGDK